MLIEVIKYFADLSWKLIILLVPISFLHFHEKLKSDYGRRDVIESLQRRQVSSTYLRYLDWVLNQLSQITGAPFGLRTLCISLTLAQAYQYIAVVIGRSRGGPSSLGEVDIFQLDKYLSIEFDYEFAVAVTLIVLTIIIVLLPRFLNRLFPSMDLLNDLSSSPLKIFIIGVIPCVLIGQAAGGMIGAISGFYAIMLPVCLIFVTLTSMTKWQSMLAFVIIINAHISTLAGIESNAIGEIGPISVGGNLSVVVSMVGLLILRRRISRRLILHLTGIMTILFSFSYILSRIITNSVITDTMLIVLLFWITLPLSNGICDYLSLGATSALLRKIRADWSRGMLWPIVYAGLDLIIASILVPFVAVSLSIAFSVCQLMSNRNLRLEEFFVASYSDPLGYGSWITIMLVTTVVWTAVHFSMIVVAMFSQIYDQNSFNQRAIDVIASGIDQLWVKIFLSTRLIMTIVIVVIVGLVVLTGAAGALSYFFFSGTLEGLALWVVRFVQ